MRMIIRHATIATACLVTSSFFAIAQPQSDATSKPRHYFVRALDGVVRRIDDTSRASTGTQIQSNGGDWDEIFAQDQMGLGSWNVSAVAVTSSKIYVGGTFAEIDGVPATNVAVYDRLSRTWSALGDKVPSGWISAIAVDGDDVYIGGYFSRVGNISTANVARWDGQSWHAVGNGMTQQSYVEGLAIYRGDLYAIGSFSAGAIRAIDVARLDGSTWRSMGVTSTIIATALHVHDDELLVGGLRIGVSDSVFGCLLSWNGVQWRSLDANLDNFDYVSSVASGPSGELFIGGFFDSDSLNSVAQWDGSAWRGLGSGIRRKQYGLQPSVTSLAVDASGDLYVAGYFFDSAGAQSAFDIARYDGDEWNTVGGGVYHGIDALDFADDTLIVVGEFTQVGSIVAHGIAGWDGASWSAFGRVHRAGGVVNKFARAANGDIFVGGDFNTAGGIGVNNVARFDGNRWQPLGAGTNSPVDAMHVDDTGVLYVGGGSLGITRADDALCEGLALWDGNSWSAHPRELRSGGQIFAITGSRNSLYVGGIEINADSLQSALVHWDGVRWLDVGRIGQRVSGGRIGAAAVTALLANGTDLYAGGDFDTCQSGTLNNVARWDGIRWDSLDEGVGNIAFGRVSSLALWNDDLIVGGDFSGAGNITADGLARFDIEQGKWKAIAQVDGSVSDITVLGNDLYFCGRFVLSDGGNIARHDGSTLSVPGGGLDNQGNAIISHPSGSIYVGGSFTHAGFIQSPGIGRWNATSLSIDDGNSWNRMQTSVLPNPSSGAASVIFATARPAHVRITIADAIGSEITQLHDDQLGGGAHRMPFDASQLPPGSYFIRIVVDGVMSIATVSVVR